MAELSFIPSMIGSLIESRGFIDELFIYQIINNYVTVKGLPDVDPITVVTELTAPNTTLNGDIAGLEKLTWIEGIDFANTSVDGDIGDLSPLSENLETLNLSGCSSVIGDLAGLNPLIQLRELYLQGSGVTGDINGLTQEGSGSNNLGFLELVDLSNTAVSGEINDWVFLSALREVELGGTNVAGDIGGFQFAFNLSKVNLSGLVNVQGDVAQLSNLGSLTEFNTEGTSVSGDISAFFDLTNLERLNLKDTFVSGDTFQFPEDLVNLSNLQFLDIRGTSINVNSLLPPVTEFYGSIGVNDGSFLPSSLTTGEVNIADIQYANAVTTINNYPSVTFDVTSVEAPSDYGVGDNINTYFNTLDALSNLSSFSLKISVTNFSFAWQNNSLTSFPAIDLSQGTNFSGAWDGNSLTSFPAIDLSQGTDFFRAWRNNSLTSFPAIDLSQGTNFSFAWDGNSLTSFPAIDLSQGTDFAFAWDGNSLTSFPAIDLSQGTDFAFAWQNNSLTSFPAIDLSQGTNFSFAWRNNSLTSFPAIDLSQGTNFSRAWEANSLNQESVENIIANIFVAYEVNNITGTTIGTDGTVDLTTSAADTRIRDLIQTFLGYSGTLPGGTIIGYLQTQLGANLAIT